MTISQTRSPRRLTAGAAALLAAGLLLGAVTPSSADAWSAHSNATNRAGRVTAFHHHFNRGTQQHQTADRADMEMMALADDTQMMDEATAYCADRFRSYDPTTGTYLGYDGAEHACP